MDFIDSQLSLSDDQSQINKRAVYYHHKGTSSGDTFDYGLESVGELDLYL